MILLFAPIICAVSSLAYLDYSSQINRLVSGFLVLCIILSAWTNFSFDCKYLLAVTKRRKSLNYPINLLYKRSLTTANPAAATSARMLTIRNRATTIRIKPAENS